MFCAVNVHASFFFVVIFAKLPCRHKYLSVPVPAKGSLLTGIVQLIS
jgi:hypothetical protein